MEDIVQWLKSQRKSDILVVNGFKFRVKRKLPNGKAYWSCANKDCQSTAVTLGQDLLVRPVDHLHSSDAAKVLSMKLKTRCQEKILQNPFNSGMQVYAAARIELVDSSPEIQRVAGLIPSFDTMKSVIHREKRLYIPSRGFVEESTFDYEFFKFDNSNKNLLLSIEFGDNGSVILGDWEFIRRFTVARDFKVIMDGTFKASSTAFYQLYIIHGSFSGQSFPLIYCFLSSKTQMAYTNMFSAIRAKLSEHGVSFSPHEIQIDFEYAAYNAARLAFPEAVIKGCFFHFGQAIWRKVQSLNMTSEFNRNLLFEDFVKLMSALALVPCDRIDEAWTHILSLCPNGPDAISDLIAYFTSTWLVPVLPSLFARQTWNHFNDLRGRTNNSAEGFHSRINSELKKQQANFWEIGQILKQVHVNMTLEMARLLAGGRTKKRKNIYIQQDQLIARLWRQFKSEQISLFELLDGLKNAIKLDV